MWRQKKFFPQAPGSKYAATAMTVTGLETPQGLAPLTWEAPEGWLQSQSCRLAAYLPLEGLVAGRRVLDVRGVPAAHDRLRRARARGVVSVGATPWRVPDASMDVVLLLDAGSPVQPDVLAEVKRVLSPQGFVAWRLAAPAGHSRGELTAPLTQAFATVESLGQVPIAGFTFDRGGSPEVVVAEDLFPTSAAPSHILALCAPGSDRPWEGLESWVVPLARPEVAGRAAPPLPDERAAWEQRIAELLHEREYLREAVMTLQDERERLERLATNLRRDADRNLARLSEQAAALEVLGLERDHAERRAGRAGAARGPGEDLHPDLSGPDTMVDSPWRPA